MIKKIITTLTTLFFFTFLNAQIYGCTDAKANNFNASADVNDGSCTYAISSINPITSYILSDTLSETSGLILWNGYLWTHNDSGLDTNLYKLDTLHGDVLETLPLSGALKLDWEEISQDDDFIYLGDFGNSLYGNRADLKIIKISKSSILNQNPIIETIYYSYSNQTSLVSPGSNNTDFDCESFIVSNDSIYLFTKQWASGNTSVYSLPKTPGTYVAQLKSTLNVNGLVTGAVFLESKKLIVLCGYSKLLQPFIYLLYDFNGVDFFSSNKRKIKLPLSFHQIEGITSANGLKYYLSNEANSQANVPQKMHLVDLSTYLDSYLDHTLHVSDAKESTSFKVFPNPTTDVLNVENQSNLDETTYMILDLTGREILSGKISKSCQSIDVSKLPEGLFLLKMGETESQFFQIKRN